MKRIIKVNVLVFFLFTAIQHSADAEGFIISTTAFTDLRIGNLNTEIVDSIKIKELLDGIFEDDNSNIVGLKYFRKNLNNNTRKRKFLIINNPIADNESKYFDKVRKLEYYISSSDVKSNIISDTIGVSTKSNSASNLSIGLNFRVHKGSNPLSSMWTLRYQDYGFSIATDSIEKNPESLKIKQASLEFRATAQGKKDFHHVVSMGLGVNYPIQVNYTDSQKNEVKNKLFEPNDYVKPTLYTILGIGLALEKKNFAITVEAVIRVNGILIDTQYLNHKNFEYSKFNENSFASKYFEKSIGISFRFF